MDDLDLPATSFGEFQATTGEVSHTAKAYGLPAATIPVATPTTTTGTALAGIPSSLSTSTTAEEPTHPAMSQERWYHRKLVRAFVVRLFIRLMMLAIFIALIKSGIIPLGDLLHAYLDWIDSLNFALALFVFGLCSIPFSAFTPGSYAPTVAAGLTFPLYAAFPLSYICMNLAALLNLVVLRYALSCTWMKNRMRKRMDEKGATTLGNSDRLLLHHPIRTVIVLRLPYLASGILNYVFSTSKLSVRHQLIGNGLGFLLGAFLFSLLGGQARSLLEIIYDGKTDPTSITVVVLISCFVIISIIGILYLVKKTTAQQAAQVVVLTPQVSQREDIPFTEMNQEPKHQEVGYKDEENEMKVELMDQKHFSDSSS